MCYMGIALRHINKGTRMASPVVITWNAANWITVVLMALIGLTVVRLGFKLIEKKKEA